MIYDDFDKKIVELRENINHVSKQQTINIKILIESGNLILRDDSPKELDEYETLAVLLLTYEGMKKRLQEKELETKTRILHFPVKTKT